MFVAREVRGLVGYSPGVGAAMRATRLYLDGAAAARSLPGEAHGRYAETVAGLSRMQLVSQTFGTVQQLLACPPQPVARRSPDDPRNHKAWRYHTYRALADAFGYTARTPLPVLCELLVKAVFPGAGDEPTTGFQYAAAAADTGGSKRRVALAEVAPAQADAPASDGRPAKQARST